MVLGATIELLDAMEAEVEADGWPVIQYERFKGESYEAYRSRVSEIEEIQHGFRMGRYRGDLAEHMESRLIGLMEEPSEALSA